jgi:hypothetical protein
VKALQQQQDNLQQQLTTQNIQFAAPVTTPVVPPMDWSESSQPAKKRPAQTPMDDKTSEEEDKEAHQETEAPAPR